MKKRGPDLAMLVLGLVIAAAIRASSFAAWLLALALGLGLVNLALAWRWPRTMPEPSRPLTVACLGLVLLLPLADLAARAHAVIANEGLHGLGEHLADRARLESDPSIAPPLVTGDRPTTYFVRASGARVHVRLGPDLSWIDGEGLGHGVFRVEYDPRAHGAPVAGARETLAELEIDGSVTARALAVSIPAAHPRWLRVSPSRSRACVPSEETDEVIVVSVGEASPERLAVGDGPTDCAIRDDGTVLVAHRFGPLWELPPGRTPSRALGPSHVVALVEAGGSRFSLRGDETTVLEALDSAGARAELRLHGQPLFVGAAEDGRAVFVVTTAPAALHRVEWDGRALTHAASRTLVVPPAAMTCTPIGDVLLALGDYVEDATPHLGNHFVEDRLSTFDAGTLALREELPTARRSPRQDHAGDVDRGASPLGLSFTESGSLLVAFAGSDEVWERRGLAPPTILDTAAYGLSAPFSAVALSDGSLIVTSPSSGRVVVLDRARSVRASIALAPSDRELLRSDESALQVRFGERAFYEATRSGVSCASCHLHGGSDGAFHNIGGRLAAPTLDVRGVAGTSPYLRDGSYPLLADLHEVAITEYRGYREPGGDRARTLEAFLRASPLPRTTVARAPASERRGLDVFVRAGCPDCHAPPAFTSLSAHPIVAVFPDAPGRAEGRVLDTPSLRGVAISAPYLYDGRAASLESIFDDHNPSDRHGHTQALGTAERSDLMVFLRSL